MAGIGFRLRKYFDQDSMLGNIKGTLYSIIISSGPWLISVLSVAFISYYAQRQLGNQPLFILKSIICYTYAASLVIFGVIEMPVTRFLADKLYINDQSTFKNVYLTLVIAAVVTGSVIGNIFYSFFDYSIFLRLLCITFFISVLLIWIAMIFLSAAKNYHHIVISFLLGGALSVIGGILLGNYYGLLGYVAGYTCGQTLIAVLLSRNLFSEFSTQEYLSFEFVSYIKRYKRLMFIGLFYYLGIWSDKVIFWFAKVGEHVDGLFYTNQYYDTAMFLSYLTIVPSLAIFLVQVETKFYVKYAYYFRSIQSKNNLNFLNSSVDEIIFSLRQTLGNLLKVQAFISLTAWYFTPEILIFLRLPSMMEPIFRYGVIGAFLQSLFLIINIVLLYFEDSKPVLYNYLVFFITSCVFAFGSIELGVKYHGIGYLFSSLITLIFSYLSVNKTLGELNLFTFMRQPLGRKNVSGA